MPAATAAHGFFEALSLVLCVAAVTTVLFQRLRQPVVLGYLLAGVLVGPHVAFPLFADPGTIHTLSELGVILLMFALGLEFRLAKLVALGPTAGVTALIQCSIMMWLGFVLGRAFGWTTPESLFAGAILAISSTTIIAKAFDEQRVRGRLRELVVGILIVEDLIAVLLMAALTAIASGAGLSPAALGLVTGRLLLFMLALVALGLLLVPRAIRAVVALRRPETTLVASVGVCFGVAWLAQWFGYSVALGAFIAGSLVAESGHAEEVERLVGPVKDVFAAIFFVSVGMLIDPAVVARYAGPIAALTLAVILGKIASVAIGAFLTGAPPRLAIQAGMSLAQIGEFSFIIAGLGVSLGATRDFEYPVAVSVSALTTLTTPWLIRASGPFASWVDRKLPHRLQTFVSLYGGWIARLRGSTPREGLAPLVRRRVALLLLDMAIVAAIVIGASLTRARLGGLLSAAFGISPARASDLVAAAAALATLPFLLGMFRLARSLGQLLAQHAFPPRSGAGVDTAAAPRNALLVSLELGIMLIAALPLLAVTQPFVGGLPTGLIVLAGALALLLSLWRQTTSLEGHVRAAAQAVVEVLAAQSRPSQGRPGASLAQVEELLPGLGQLASIRVEPYSPVVGRSLAEIDLRSLTGATVLAIHRGDERHGVPSARDVLQAGDVLALAGTEDALALAATVLRDGP